MNHLPISRRSVLRGAGLVVGGAAAATGLGGLAPAAAVGARTLTTAYVEVNDHSIANVGKYALASTGAPVFDLGLIFAANINYDGQAAYLHNNPNVQRTLDNAATEIRPLQAMGIKVLLSVLGNHQGVGFANFPDYAAADAFAQQLADTVYAYGLDGIDFDDEWARYDLGAPVNDWSFVYLCQALRARMPDKLITLYYIGESSQRLEYGGVRVGDLIDHSWNPYYGWWLVPDVPGLRDKQLGPAAVNIQGTSAKTMRQLAHKTAALEYGVFNTYNLPGRDVSATLSHFTRELHGSDAVYLG